LCKKASQMDNYAFALAMRGQLGDASVTKELTALLDSPDREVRGAVVNGIGANWGNHANGAPFGVVANPALLPALAKAHRDESDERARESISRAMLNIRAVLRAQSKK